MENCVSGLVLTEGRFGMRSEQYLPLLSGQTVQPTLCSRCTVLRIGTVYHILENIQEYNFQKILQVMALTSRAETLKIMS